MLNQKLFQEIRNERLCPDSLLTGIRSRCHVMGKPTYLYRLNWQWLANIPLPTAGSRRGEFLTALLMMNSIKASIIKPSVIKDNRFLWASDFSQGPNSSSGKMKMFSVDNIEPRLCSRHRHECWKTLAKREVGAIVRRMHSGTYVE